MLPGPSCDTTDRVPWAPSRRRVGMRDGRSRRKVDHRVESHEMNGLEQPVAGAGDDVRAATWGVHGDYDLLVEAARILRYGLESGVFRSHPPGEYALFGLAR